MNLYFQHLPDCINFFESQHIELKERINKLNQVFDTFNKFPGEFGRLQEKVKGIFDRNPDNGILKQFTFGYFTEEITAQKYPDKKQYVDHPPLSSTDERSLSIFKDFISKDNRTDGKNLEQLLIVNINKEILRININ